MNRGCSIRRQILSAIRTRSELFILHRHGLHKFSRGRHKASPFKFRESNQRKFRESNLRPVSKTIDIMKDEFDKPEQRYKEFLRRAPEVKNEILKRRYLYHYDFGEETFEQKWHEYSDMLNSSRGEALAVSLRISGLSYNQRIETIDACIRNTFIGFVMENRVNKSGLTDLRYPNEWFPTAREMQRSIHLHVGPTNSGKTYQALKRLEKAKTGIYAGPLRLLAHEVYTRMNASGRKCALITGEERRYPEIKEGEEPPLQSCTVEMVTVSHPVDVAVIDEIQMLGHQQRGWAWTQAFLGVRAKEVHLCGEERVVPIIKELVAFTGDKLEIHRYERLSPLKMMDKSLEGNIHSLRKGDCIISFSVVNIHRVKSMIEQVLRKKVAVIYGSLPPETRAQQARLFNDPNSGYDILVASDAVGMGLNLSIKRVVFFSSAKNYNDEKHPLTISEIKQIAGRAGRYRGGRPSDKTLENEEAKQSPQASEGGDKIDPNTSSKVSQEQDKDTCGLVTTLYKHDFDIVAKAMQAEPEPITSAGILPPGLIIERYSAYYPPGTPFNYVLTRLLDNSRMHPRFHMCTTREMLELADALNSTPLSIKERIVFCAAPWKVTDSKYIKLFRALAKCVAESASGDLLDIPGYNFYVLDAVPTADKTHLDDLLFLHQAIVLYLWLSYRFSGVFTSRALAFHVRDLTETAIEKALVMLSKPEHLIRKLVREERRQRMIERAKSLYSARTGSNDPDIPNLYTELSDNKLPWPALSDHTTTSDSSETTHV